MELKPQLVLLTLMLAIPLTAVACRDDKTIDNTIDNSGEPIRLGEYLGLPGIDLVRSSGSYSVSSEEQAFFLEREQKMEELIAECMAREGFEYIPVTSPASIMFPDVDYGSEEYVREQGFGITTSFGVEQSYEIDWTDPNAEITDALSESERQAYEEALFGVTDSDLTTVIPETETDTETEQAEPLQDGTDEPSEEDLSDYFSESCTGQAYETVYSVFQILDELESEFTLIEESFKVDPRILAADTEWSECMSAKGYSYENLDDMWSSLSSDFVSRFNEIIMLSMPDALSEELITGKSPEEIEDLYRQAEAEARARIDQEALAALQEEERDIAIANFECSKSLNEKLSEIAAEYEAQFIDNNRAVLDEVRNQLQE